MRQYGLGLADIRLVCTCKASAYYRALLDGKAEGEQPSIVHVCLLLKRQVFAAHEIIIKKLNPGACYSFITPKTKSSK